MSAYDNYYDRDRDQASRRYVREERREDPRYFEREREYTRQYTSNRDLVPAGRPTREDSDLSVEEIQRGFPPPSGRDIRRSRSTEHYYDDDYDRYDDRYDDRRSSRRSPASVYHEEEEIRTKSKGMSKNEKIIAAVAGAALLVGGKELYDRHEAKDGHKQVQRNALSSAALAGVGALAAYQGAEFYSKQQAKTDQKATYILHRGRDGQVQEYYSDEDEDPKQKKGNKNFLESAIAATGLGAAVKSLTGGDKDKDKDDRSDTRSRGGDRDDDDGKSKNANKIQKAAMASLLAGATEAFRVAKEPGGWKGEKAKRVFTAAAGAAAVDSAQDSDHGKLGMAQSVIGGLVGNRLVNGSKGDIEEDKKTGRSRSRSRARSQGGGMGGAGGLAALATAGLGAVGAKKAYDNYQESRSRSRGRAPSDGSRSPSPPPRARSRSRSVVDKARNSLAKLGIGAGAGGGALAVEDRRRDDDDYSDRGSRRGGSRSRRYSDDYDDDYRSRDRGGNRDRDRDYYDDDRDYRGSSRRDSSRRGGKSDYTSESDLGDSEDEKKQQKKLRAHGVYQSMEKRNARHKAVKAGRLSPEEAKKLKTKAMMQDAASVGIAAMGIKGAIGELKEAKNLNHECKDFQWERQKRHEKREMRRQKALEANANQRREDSRGPARLRNDGYDSDSEDEYYGRRYPARYYDDNPYGAAMPAPVRGRA